MFTPNRIINLGNALNAAARTDHFPPPTPSVTIHSARNASKAGFAEVRETPDERSRVVARIESLMEKRG